MYATVYVLATMRCQQLFEENKNEGVLE